MLKMILLEYLRNAEETLEIYQGNCDNVWVHSYKGRSAIFPECQSFVRWHYGGAPVPHKVCDTDELNKHIKVSKDYLDIELEEVNNV